MALIFGNDCHNVPRWALNVLMHNCRPFCLFSPSLVTICAQVFPDIQTICPLILVVINSLWIVGGRLCLLFESIVSVQRKICLKQREKRSDWLKYELISEYSKRYCSQKVTLAKIKGNVLRSLLVVSNPYFIYFIYIYICVYVCVYIYIYIYIYIYRERERAC